MATYTFKATGVWQVMTGITDVKSVYIQFRHSEGEFRVASAVPSSADAGVLVRENNVQAVKTALGESLYVRCPSECLCVAVDN